MRTSLLFLLLTAPVLADTVDVFSGNIHVGSHQKLNNGRPEDQFRLNPDGRGRQTFRGINLGLDFEVLAENGILITELGVWDDNSDGLSSGHFTSIYDITTGTLLGTVEFAPGDGVLRDQYRYLPLADPLFLPVGSEFAVVVSYGTDNQDSNGNSGAIFQDLEPLPTFDDNNGALLGIGRARAGVRGAGGRFGIGDFPTILDTGPFNRYHAGSFRYSTSPEPSPVVLIGSVLAGGRLRDRLVLLAFAIVCVGAIPAPFRYDEIAMLRLPVPGVFVAAVIWVALQRRPRK